MNNFALKLNEWFRYYDPNFLEVPNALQLTNFTDKKVLEIGCATGKSTMQAYKKASMYFGIDNDIRVINFCKANYHESNLFFLLDNAENLLFKSGYFDIVYLPWILNYIKNKDQAINEIFRVLKSTGKLVLVDNSNSCDYNDILSGITKNVALDPKLAYEAPITKKFRLVQKVGPLEVPYIFPSFRKALELVRFIIEDYLGIKLDENKVLQLNKNLSRYKQKNGKVIFYERPLLYLFTKSKT